MRTVNQIIEIVSYWVQTDGSQIPGFAGAYLFGGITQLPKDAHFPDYRDVDLIVVSTAGTRPDQDNLELNLDGIMLEVGILGTEEHSSPEAILANPNIAPNFAVTTILADPQNLLTPLQVAVAKSYAERKWVIARCETEKQKIFGFLDAMKTAQSALEILSPLWDLMNYLSGLLALACLKKPTHRRTLALMKEILVAQGQAQLHEEALHVWGAAHMSREQVETFLSNSIRIFDRALAIQRTPTTVSFKLKPHLRPYFLAASQEMIEEGNHREATFWIIGCLAIGYFTMLSDAGDEEKQLWQSEWDAVMEAFGLANAKSRQNHYRAATALAEQIFQVADQMIDRLDSAKEAPPDRLLSRS